ncbi:MAG: hypothetical protein H7A36_03725 [Chlamydiales bacterium]|nr:hypothetical protein [Chlamydiales bacterium]
MAYLLGNICNESVRNNVGCGNCGMLLVDVILGIVLMAIGGGALNASGGHISPAAAYGLLGAGGGLLAIDSIIVAIKCNGACCLNVPTSTQASTGWGGNFLRASGAEGPFSDRPHAGYTGDHFLHWP